MRRVRHVAVGNAVPYVEVCRCIFAGKSDTVLWQRRSSHEIENIRYIVFRARESVAHLITTRSSQQLHSTADLHLQSVVTRLGRGFKDINGANILGWASTGKIARRREASARRNSHTQEDWRECVGIHSDEQGRKQRVRTEIW